MIVLFNLNKYVGGGETLVIRLAQYLHIHSQEYRILTCDTNCWIFDEAKKLGLKCSIWPSKIDSINYQNTRQQKQTISAINELYRQYHNIRIFTFCMRDLHNALFIFSRTLGLKTIISHGIYHPEDVFYLSSFSFAPSRYIQFNREIIKSLHTEESVLFVTNNGLRTSLSSNGQISESLIMNSKFAPLPIPLPDKISKSPPEPSRKLRVICISRFVVFKIAAVLAIVRYAANQRKVELLVIGHGPWKFILDFYLYIKSVKNIQIITGVTPSQLDSYIETCDIGYAQGTSILEIAKHGLPVLIAPYSKLRDLFNNNFPSLGVFGVRRDSKALGDIDELRGEITYSITDCIESVRNNYSFYQSESINFIKTFSTDLVCKIIHEFILSATFSPEGLSFDPPNPPLIKRFVKFFFRIG